MLYGICYEGGEPIVYRWRIDRESAARSWASGERWDGYDCGRRIYRMPLRWRLPSWGTTEELVQAVLASGTEITPGRPADRKGER